MDHRDINEIEKDGYIRISNTLIAMANCKDSEIGESTVYVKYDEKVYGSYNVFRGGSRCDPARGCLAGSTLTFLILIFPKTLSILADDTLLYFVFIFKNA